MQPQPDVRYVRTKSSPPCSGEKCILVGHTNINSVCMVELLYFSMTQAKQAQAKSKVYWASEVGQSRKEDMRIEML